jgi:hypothetical protein
MKARLIGLVAALLVVVAVPKGPATTLPSLIFHVSVSLKPSTVTLSAKQVRRGNYVEFKVRNTTAQRRLFSVAGRTIAIPAGKYRLLVVSFDVRGRYSYVSRSTTGTAIRGTFRVV